MRNTCTHRRWFTSFSSSLFVIASALTAGCGTQPIIPLPGDPFSPGTYIVAFSPNDIDGFTSLGPALNALVEAWDPRAKMSTGRQSPGGCTLNDKVYAVGGDLNGVLSSVEVFDPDPNLGEWAPVASMPTARMALSAVAANGRIYALGGVRKVNNVSQVLSTNEEYDPNTDTWAPRADLPAPRSYAASAVVNDRIYVIGGQAIVNNLFTDVNTTFEYDPATNTWTTKAPMPTARSTIAAAVANGRIYVIGGSGFGSTKVEEYDPVTDSWATKKPMINARGGPGAFEWNGLIYVVGGKGTGGGFVLPVEIYNPLFDIWGDLGDMTRPRYYFGYGAIGPHLYCFGGTVRYAGNTVIPSDNSTDRYFAANPEYLFRKN